MAEPTPELNKCPSCGALAAAFANPHCASPTCRWNDCQCLRTYDRFTGTHCKTYKIR